MGFPFKQQHNEEKSADKAFNQSFTVSVISILLCIVALCSTSWAWFSGSVTSGGNEISAASCDVQAIFTYAVTDGIEELAANADGTYTLAQGVTYTVTVSAEGTARSSYCILTVDGQHYFTQQVDTAAPNNVISFTLTFTEEDKVITFSPLWGTSSRTERDLHNGGVYTDNDFRTVTP